jgi:MFS family permease
VADPPPDPNARKLKAFQDAIDKASDGVRSVAKWVVGGVVGIAGAVISGASLTSLGSLDWGWRLQLAIIAAAIGFCFLGYLMWFALYVITPRSYSMEDIANGTDITPRRLRIIEKRVKGLLPNGVSAIAEFTKTGIKLANEVSKGGAASTVVTKAEDYERRMPFVRTSIIYEHLLRLFWDLRLRLFIVTPLLALSFGVFAWSANPPKDDRVGSPTIIPGTSVPSPEVSHER